MFVYTGRRSRAETVLMFRVKQVLENKKLELLNLKTKYSDLQADVVTASNFINFLSAQASFYKQKRIIYGVRQNPQYYVVWRSPNQPVKMKLWNPNIYCMVCMLARCFGLQMLHLPKPQVFHLSVGSLIASTTDGKQNNPCVPFVVSVLQVLVSKLAA